MGAIWSPTTFNSELWINYTVEAEKYAREHAYKQAECHFLQALFVADGGIKNGQCSDKVMHLKVLSHQNLAKLYESQMLLRQASIQLKKAYEFCSELADKKHIPQAQRNKAQSAANTSYFRWLSFVKKYRNTNACKLVSDLSCRINQLEEIL